MQIYIKNSKSGLPDFVCGIITQMRDYSCQPSDELGNQPVCAYLYWRATSTRRRVWSGVNHWDLFVVATQDGYVVDDAPAIVLGRYNGEDIGFTVRRIVAPSVPLPNGTVLPAKTEVVDDMRFLSIQPCIDRGMEGSVLDAFDRLPFHQPGGEDSRREEYPGDLWEREFVSYFAHQCPDQFRAAADPLQAAKETLLPNYEAVA